MEALIAAVAKEGSLAVLILMICVLGLSSAVVVLFAAWRQDNRERGATTATVIEKLTEAVTALRLDLAKGRQ